MATFYDTLGVPKTANMDEIKRAYRKLSFIHHPDKNNNDPACTTLFQKIAEAYTILSDPPAREQYDNELKYGANFGGLFGGRQQNHQNHHHVQINPHELFNMLFGGIGDSMGGGIGGIGGILQSLGGLGGGEIHIIHGNGIGGIGGIGGGFHPHPMMA